MNDALEIIQEQLQEFAAAARRATSAIDLTIVATFPEGTMSAFETQSNDNDLGVDPWTYGLTLTTLAQAVFDAAETGVELITRNEKGVEVKIREYGASNIKKGTRYVRD